MNITTTSIKLTCFRNKYR